MSSKPQVQGTSDVPCTLPLRGSISQVKKHITTSNLIRLIAIWLGISTILVLTIALIGVNPNTRAVMLMGSGLILLWVLLCGSLMRWQRDAIRQVFQNLGGDWRVKFVLFATLLALVEEAITTTMTNLAPLFGVPVGSAYITASANYFDVVCLHSVVVFIPMFIAWALLLSRYAFSPNAVFLLFGLTGTLAEMSIGGTQALAEFGMWFFVYGLMVYLPAYCIPTERNARPPRWWHYILAVLLPFLFAAPVAGIVSFLHPIPIHFPPILPDS